MVDRSNEARGKTLSSLGLLDKESMSSAMLW
jgi:hypothetical protein